MNHELICNGRVKGRRDVNVLVSGMREVGEQLEGGQLTSLVSQKIHVMQRQWRSSESSFKLKLKWRQTLVRLC